MSRVDFVSTVYTSFRITKINAEFFELLSNVWGDYETNYDANYTAFDGVLRNITNMRDTYLEWTSRLEHMLGL